MSKGGAALDHATICTRARRPTAGCTLLAFRKQVLQDREHIAGGDKLQRTLKHTVERHGRIELLDELPDVGEVDRTRNDKNAVGARVGNDLCFADDKIGFELTGTRTTEGSLDNLSLRIDLRGAAGLTRSSSALFPLLEQGLQKFDHLLGVGPFEVDKFGHDLRGRHIDHGLKSDELLDDRDVFRDEHGLHIGYRGEGGVGLGRTDKGLEKLRGLLGREVAEFHEIADHLIGSRQHIGCGKDRDALSARKFRGAEDFYRLVVDRDERIAVEQEGGLDQADGLAARNLSGHNNGQRLPLGEHGVAHKTLIGQHLVQTEDLVNRGVGEGESHGWFGLDRTRDGGGGS